jgi:hypothetical protein
MDAPTYSEETVLRAIEAMRDAAKAVVIERREVIHRNGHQAVVEAMDGRARSIGAMDARSILASVASSMALADETETSAFEKEAKRLGFAVIRRSSGELFYPMTKRAWSIWQAAIRWKAGEPA